MKPKKRSESKTINKKSKKKYRRKYEKKNIDRMRLYDFLHSPATFPRDKVSIFFTSYNFGIHFKNRRRDPQ